MPLRDKADITYITAGNLISLQKIDVFAPFGGRVFSS